MQESFQKPEAVLAVSGFLFTFGKQKEF